jgi:hypothetical protein
VALTSCQDQVQGFEERIAGIEAKLAQTPEIEDPSELRALVDSIAAKGPLEGQLQQLTESCDREKSAIRTALGRLRPTCPVAIEQLVVLPLPSTETVKLIGQEMLARGGEADQARESLRKTREGLLALEKRIAAFQHGETVPSEKDLENARRDRDRGLNTVRERLVGEASPSDENQFIARHAPGRHILDAVEACVQQCDQIADRLRHEASRIVQWHTLEAEHDELHNLIPLLAADAQEKKEVFDRAETHWRSIWEGGQIAAGTPGVMQDWINQFVWLRERVEKWLDAMQQCGLLASQIETLRRQIGDALAGGMAGDSLRRDLELGRKRIKDLDEARNTRKNLVDELSRVREEAVRADSKLATAVEAQNRWKTAWAEAVRPLQLGPNVDIATVETYLVRIDEMQEHLKDARIKAAQIREIETDRDSVLQGLNDLRKRIDSRARTSAVESIATDFHEIDRDLSEVRGKRTKLEQIQAQLAIKRAELETATAEQQEAEAMLAALVSEAGVADATRLPSAIEGSRRRSQAEQQLRELQGTFAQQAQGELPEKFEAAALAYRDGIDQAIEALNEEISRIDDEVSRAEITASQADEQLRTWQKASDNAAMARQEGAFQARQLQDQVSEYATLHLARNALDRAVQRYRSIHQHSMLARAGSYFQNLTDGDFDGLEIDNEDGTAVLIAQRSDRQRADPSVPVDGLSDGTRDQLFLALRLAGVERHLADREPMPLIIDDVLVNFDDRRASATLRALADLSKQTQILLFTHHRHIVEIARQSVPGVLVYHELQQRR